MAVTDPYGEGSRSSSMGMHYGYVRLEYDKAGRRYEGDLKHRRWTGKGRLRSGDSDFYEGGLRNNRNADKYV